jgi:uncharacterized membrane protein YdjX (TVP38/TMEM64 family)
MTSQGNLPNSRRILNRESVATLAAGSMLLALVAAAGWSFWTQGVVYVLCSQKLTATEKIEGLQQFFARFGLAAPLAYVVLVTCEVVLAPLPGSMLYAPGGLVFGGFWGGLLSLTGNVLGAGLACQVIRILGRTRFERILDRGSLRNYETRLVRSGVWIVFLLRVNPLTSSDFVSYAAGLTTMPLWKLTLGTALGMAPLCWTQAYLADELLTAFPHLIFPLMIACVIYSICVILVVKRMMMQVATEPVRSE